MIRRSRFDGRGARRGRRSREKERGVQSRGEKGLGARGTGGFIRCGVRGTGNAPTQIARGTPGGWARDQRVWLLDFVALNGGCALQAPSTGMGMV